MRFSPCFQFNNVWIFWIATESWSAGKFVFLTIKGSFVVLEDAAEYQGPKILLIKRGSINTFSLYAVKKKGQWSSD